MTYLRILLVWALLLGEGAPSFANFAMSPSGSTTAFAIDGSNQGTSLCAAASTECPAAVPINTAGSPLFTSTTPGVVNLSQMGGTSINSGCVAALNGFSSTVPSTVCGVFGSYVLNATTAIPNNADGVAVQTGAANSPANNYAYGFNGSTWDRQYTLGNQTQVDVAQTVTASSAYTAGNAVGGLMTVANAARVSGSLGASGTSGILQNVAVNSKSVQTSQMDIFIFNANPSGSTCTDKTAFVLATADFNKVIGVISVPSTVTNNNGWFSGGTGSVGQANNQAMAYALSSATSLFACMVTRGTPTFTATTDISVKFQMLRS